MRRLTAAAAIAGLSWTLAFGATSGIDGTNAASKLDVLKRQYDTVVAQAESTLAGKSQDALAAYGAGLAAAKESLQRQGKLDTFLLIQAEKKRFDIEKTVLEPSGNADAAELDRLIGIYKKAIATARADQMKSMHALRQRYVAALDKLVKEHMLANQIEQATKANDESKRIQAEIAGLRSELSAGGLALEESNAESSEPAAKPGSASRIPLSLRKGLVLCYSFDRDEHGKVTDSSPKKNSGKVLGAQWTAKGKVGGAYKFDGADNLISSSSPALTQGNFTISAWLKPSNSAATGPTQAIFSQGQHGWKRFTCWFTVANGQPGCTLNGDGLPAPQAPAGLISENEWVQFLFVLEGTTGSIYVNGKEVRTGDMKGFRGIEFDGTGLLNIGHSTETINRSPSTWFTGTMDEVMVFNRALTSQEIKQLFSAQK